MYWKLTEKSGFYFFGGEIWGLENSRKLIFTRKKPTNWEPQKLGAFFSIWLGGSCGDLGFQQVDHMATENHMFYILLMTSPLWNVEIWCIGKTFELKYYLHCIQKLLQVDKNNFFSSKCESYIGYANGSSLLWPLPVEGCDRIPLWWAYTSANLLGTGTPRTW